jgi:hypothetical protein
VNRGAAAVTALAVLLTVTACGPTFVDESIAVRDSAVEITLPPVDPDAPVDELLSEIEVLMLDLDERIIDEEAHVETLARIDALWVAAQPQIREDDPDDLFNFAQAIELARTGVERRRPADASKGYKIFVDVIDHYLER